jgi:rhodanese-related sulfurtransferase
MKRFFSTTVRVHGLYKNYIAKVKPEIKEMKSEELFALLQKVFHHNKNPLGKPKNMHILDVREPIEWNQDRLPYAVYTGRSCLERDVEGIVSDPFDTIVCYCAGGYRSMLATKSLQDMGYKNVYSLQGGIGEWKQQGKQIQLGKTFSE